MLWVLDVDKQVKSGIFENSSHMCFEQRDDRDTVHDDNKNTNRNPITPAAAQSTSV